MSSTTGRTPEFDCCVLLVGEADHDAVSRSLRSLQLLLDELPAVSVQLVVIADVAVLERVHLLPARDVALLPGDGLSRAERLRRARSSSTAEQHLLLGAGEEVVQDHVRSLAAKLGEIPTSAALAHRGDSSLVGRLNGLGLSLAGRTHIDEQTVLEGPVHLPLGMENLLPTHVGAFTYSGSLLSGAVTSVGRYCSIAEDVTFGAAEHPTTFLSTSPFQYNGGHMWQEHLRRGGASFCHQPRPATTNQRPVVIGNDVWIGAGAYIRGGVTLGDGCIVGTHAVVTKDVPPYAVVVGNPGRVVKSRFDPTTVARLLDLAWWQYDCADFNGIDVQDVTHCIDVLVEKRDSGELRPYRGFRRPFLELVRQLEAASSPVLLGV